jgi:hypothetical protein
VAGRRRHARHGRWGHRRHPRLGRAAARVVGIYAGPSERPSRRLGPTAAASG